RPYAQAETLRQAFGAVTPLSQPTADSSPQGEPSLSGNGPQSLSLRRGGTRSVTERCAARRAAARKRPYAQAETLRQAFGAVTPLRRFAPAPLKGSLSLSGNGPQSLSLRRGGTASAVTERCAARRAAAR